MPTAFKNSLGDITPQQSLLDTVISLPSEERSGAQTLKALCNAISQQSQNLVLVGTIPVNRFLHYHDNRGLKSERARDALADLLRSVDPNGNLSWQLLGGPGTDTYFLNIHRVKPLRQVGITFQMVQTSGKTRPQRIRFSVYSSKSNTLLCTWNGATRLFANKQYPAEESRSICGYRSFVTAADQLLKWFFISRITSQKTLKIQKVPANHSVSISLSDPRAGAIQNVVLV